MLSKAMQAALNDQIQQEYYAAYLYLSMAAYCHSVNLHGFGHWMREQSREEREHGTRLYDYIVERGGDVILQDIKKPPHTFSSVVDMMEKTLTHEQKVTASIHKLYELAGKLRDHATQVALQWFLTEQVEEEATAKGILEKLKMIPERTAAILYLDKELGSRACSAQK